MFACTLHNSGKARRTSLPMICLPIHTAPAILAGNIPNVAQKHKAFPAYPPVTHLLAYPPASFTPLSLPTFHPFCYCSTQRSIQIVVTSSQALRSSFNNISSSMLIHLPYCSTYMHACMFVLWICMRACLAFTYCNNIFSTLPKFTLCFLEFSILTTSKMIGWRLWLHLISFFLFVRKFVGNNTKWNIFECQVRNKHLRVNR